MATGAILVIAGGFVVLGLMAWRDIKRAKARRHRANWGAGAYGSAVDSANWADSGGHCGASDSGGDCGGGGDSGGGGSD